MDNSKKGRLLLQYLLILLLAAAISTILYFILNRADLNMKVYFDPDPTVSRSPLTGFAPDARDEEQCERSDLVFILLRWADWEKEKGVYDTAFLEDTFHIQRWREENKHAVLRFVCDIPGETDHLDVPAYVAEAAGGTPYDTALGKGFSPDYASAAFREAHRDALKRLAEYCNRSSFVAFVELGSLGHWGEFHASDAAGRSLMPDGDICNEYIHLYADSFESARLLTRRNYESAVSEGMGVYNDMIGSAPDTEEWLSWLRAGGQQRTSGTPLGFTPVPEPGRAAPAGGEFAGSIPMETILGKSFGDVLGAVSASGLTFIGPNVPDLTDEGAALARESILRRLGYRLYVSCLQTEYDFSRNLLNVTLTWKNNGAAGFFFDWPVTLYVYDREDKAVYWETLALNLTDLNRAEEISAVCAVPFADSIREGFSLGVQITDYRGVEIVPLAIDPEELEDPIDGVQILYRKK